MQVPKEYSRCSTKKFIKQSTVNSQQSTDNSQLSTVNRQQSTVNNQQSTDNSQQSTVNKPQSTVNDQRSTIDNYAFRMCLLCCYARPFAFRHSKRNKSFVQNPTDFFLCCRSISPLRTRSLDVRDGCRYAFFRIFGERTIRISMVHWACQPYGLMVNALCREAVGKFRRRVPPQIRGWIFFKFFVRNSNNGIDGISRLTVKSIDEITTVRTRYIRGITYRCTRVRDTREQLENLDCTFAELGLHFNGPSRFARFLDTLSRDVCSWNFFKSYL